MNLENVIVICITVVIICLILCLSFLYTYKIDSDHDNTYTNVPRQEIKRLQEQTNDVYKFVLDLGVDVANAKQDIEYLKTTHQKAMYFYSRNPYKLIIAGAKAPVMKKE